MIDARLIAAVGAGAAIGGIARLLVSQLVVARAGPAYGFYATLFINASGSFFIGVVLETTRLTGTGPIWRSFLATGILGGYTTFSTFSFEALNLALNGALPAAIWYVAGSVTLGVAGAFAGILGARAVVH